MKPSLLLITFSIILPCLSLCQEKITGTVINGSDFSNLSGVHIYSSQRGTVSDSLGHFSLTISPTETVTFSIIGFEELKLDIQSISDSLNDIIITLREKAYVLETYVQNGNEVFETIIKVPKKREAIFLPGVSKPFARTETDDDYHLGIGKSIQSPLSALNRLTNKQYKEKKKYYELRKEEHIQSSLKSVAYKKLDELMKLQRIFRNRSEYPEIISTCKLQIKGLAKMTIYDLIVHVNKTGCLETLAIE